MLEALQLQFVTAGKPLLDVDGLQLLDDGFQTCKALKMMEAEYVANADPNFLWPENVVEIFKSGLPMDFRTYGEVYERETHIAYQTLRHDDAQNKFRPSSVWQKINVVERYAAKTPGRDMAKVSASMLEVFGKSKKPTIARWVRAHSNLHPEVVKWLATYKMLPDSYIFDNAFLLGPGPKLNPSDAIVALNLLRKGREDGRQHNPQDFKATVCSPLLVKTAWERSMRSQFGSAAESPVPCTFEILAVLLNSILI